MWLTPLPAKPCSYACCTRQSTHMRKDRPDSSTSEHTCHSCTDLLSIQKEMEMCKWSYPSPSHDFLSATCGSFPAEQLADFLAAIATLPSARCLSNVGAGETLHLQIVLRLTEVFFSGCIPNCLFTVQFNKFCNKKSYTVLVCQWNQIIFPGIFQRINIHSLQCHSRWIKSLQQLQLIKWQSSTPHAFSSNVRFLF